MRVLYALFVLAIALGLAGADQVTSPSYQVANQTLNNANQYVAFVNSSGYLTYYPRLSQAYADLGSAAKMLNTSPASSVVYSNKAVQEARAEYDRINSYRGEAILVMAVLTVAGAVFLALLTIPVKGRMGKNGKGRGSLR